jgi:hypothetical protein
MSPHVIALLNLILLAIVHTAPRVARDVPADLTARTPAMGNSLILDSVASFENFQNWPPCTFDLCQPIVNVPGFEPQWDYHGRRTELFLSLVDRMDLGALSSAARWISARGLTVDYRPPDRARAVQVNVFMRWRIDAFSVPIVLAE